MGELTPTTRLLKAYLNVDASKTPDEFRRDTAKHTEDLFAKAFQDHINALDVSTGVLDGIKTCSPEAVDPQLFYLSPPESTGQATDSPLQVPYYYSNNNAVAFQHAQGYLAYVLSSDAPDDFFSYAQKCLAVGSAFPSDPGILSRPRTLPQNDPTAVQSVRDIPSDVATGPERLQPDMGYSLLHAAPIPGHTQDEASGAVPAEKPKQARKRRRGPLSEEEERVKHDAFLERNRKAAGKCRTKKKDKVEKLMHELQSAQSRNSELNAEHWELLEEVGRLRILAQSHGRLADVGWCQPLNPHTPLDIS